MYRHRTTWLCCWDGRTERLRLAGCSGGIFRIASVGCASSAQKNANAENRRQSKRGWTCQLAR
jgi:hypothetical protein